MKSPYAKSAILIGVICLWAAPLLAPPLSEPLAPQPYADSYHASDRTIELLLRYLDNSQFNADPLLRERLVYDLGRGVNSNGVASVRDRLINDPDWRVRASAARALGVMPLDWIAADFKTALADKDPHVASQAVRSVVKHRYTDAAADVVALLDRGEPWLTAQVIDALTRLSRAMDTPTLLVQLESSEATVRLAAVRNAELQAEPNVVQAIGDLAGADANPAVRGEALATYGKLAGIAAEPTLLAATGDADYRVRAGAAEGLGYVAAGSELRGLLSDTDTKYKSAAVRAAASRSVGRLKDAEAINALWQNFDHPVDDVHQAARDALASIGTPEVAAKAGQTLVTEANKLLALRQSSVYKGKPTAVTDKPEVNFTRRQAAGASYILGAMKSREQYDFHLSLVGSLAHDDPLVGEVAESLGRIGDPAALPQFVKFLTTNRGYATRFADTFNDMQGPSVRFSSRPYEGVLLGIGHLGLAKGLTEIEATLNHAAFFIRLPSSTVDNEFPNINLRAYQAFVMLAPKLDSAKLVDIPAQIVQTRRFRGEVKWRAAHYIGAQKIDDPNPKTLAALRDLLDSQRTSYELMRVAAWSIQQLTGATPVVGNNMVVRQPKEMVVADESK